MIKQGGDGMKRHMLRTSLWTLLALLALLATVPASQPAGAQGGTCIDDLTGRTNVCSANDVQLSYLLNEQQTSCMSGEPVTLNLTARLIGTSAERYDIGMFLALDGGDAATGSCHHNYLPPPLAAGGTCTVSGDDCEKDADCPAGETCTGGYNPGSLGAPGGPFWDAEPDDAPDECGDLEQGVDTYYRLSPVTVLCIDSDGDGFLDISTAVSWDNQRTNTCTGVGGAIPNTPAKCRYGTAEVANVTVIEPPGDIQVQKSAEPAQLYEPGGWVEFTYSVENPSQTTITLESLVDSVYGPLEQADGDCAVPQTLGPAGTYVCSINAQVLGAPGIYENTVTASGTDANQDPVSDTATAAVTILAVTPGDIQVQKSAEPAQLLVPGGWVKFTYSVENPSSITVTLESLVDSVYGPLEQADGDCAVPQTLSPADTYVCSINAEVLGDPGVYENTVTASGTDWNEDPVSDTATAAVTIAMAPPGDIQVQKSAQPAQLLEPGGWVEFTYSVENPSSITVTLESLVDSVYGPLELADGDCTVPQTLSPAGTYVCSIDAEVLGSPGIYENLVTASGVDWNQDPVSDTATATVIIAMEPPETGAGTAAAVVIGGMVVGGLALLLAGAVLRRRTAQ